MESFWLLHHAPSCAAIAPHFIRQLPPDQVGWGGSVLVGWGGSVLVGVVVGQWCCQGGGGSQSLKGEIEDAPSPFCPGLKPGLRFAGESSKPISVIVI